MKIFDTKPPLMLNTNAPVLNTKAPLLLTNKALDYFNSTKEKRTK